LRCEVREQLIDFLQRNHPEALPRRRSEVVVSDVATPKTTKTKDLRQATGA
jgi:hypothetical protein